MHWLMTGEVVQPLCKLMQYMWLDFFCRRVVTVRVRQDHICIFGDPGIKIKHLIY